MAGRQNPSAYDQYFCGMDSFSIKAPCAPTELVEFRNRIGEKGIELILKESIRINLVLENRKKEEEDKKNGKDNRGRKADADQTAFIDSTVQEKNVTFPTDSKLLNKIIRFCNKVAQTENLRTSTSGKFPHVMRKCARGNWLFEVRLASF